METFSINNAFSKQSAYYDEDDRGNKILQDMRQQVYDHVDRFLKPQSNMLELNAGTGTDALRFAQNGHRVHATDLSDGMIDAIQRKIQASELQQAFTCQQLSFDHLERISGGEFDYVFSNFGGLNCLDDLEKAARHLPAILKPDAYVTWVIMPPVSFWELGWALRGRLKSAFRRWHKNGVKAHLEGEYFTTYYHGVNDVARALGPGFKKVAVESLCAVSPPPSKGNFPALHPRIYENLRRLDAAIRHLPLIKRTGDHIIVTFQRR